MAENPTATSNREGRALLAALTEVDAEAPTACEGWSAHDIAAHLAAGAKEVADLIEAKLDGRPSRPTRSFEEREAPCRAMPHGELLECLVMENKRKLAAYEALESTSGEVAFTGANLDARRLGTHSRSEAAIHRWDLVGGDDVSRELLSQPELTSHAVWVLNAMPVLQESTRALGTRVIATRHSDVTIALRCEDRHDVVLHAERPIAWMEESAPPAAADVVVHLRADNRLLAVWGRRPTDLDLRVDGEPDLAAALEDVIWPHARPWSPA